MDAADYFTTWCQTGGQPVTFQLINKTWPWSRSISHNSYLKLNPILTYLCMQEFNFELPRKLKALGTPHPVPTQRGVWATCDESARLVLTLPQQQTCTPQLTLDSLLRVTHVVIGDSGCDKEKVPRSLQ